MTTNTPVIYGLNNRSLRAVAAVLQSIAIALLLASCGGGASTETLPQTVAAPQSNYSGPAPLTPDTQAFRIALWENIRTQDRCGECHSVTGGISPMFARSDNVNFAYSAALQLVDDEVPALSRLVTKVGTGHNCWDSTTQACVDTMTRWIENWLGSGAAGGRQIVLTAPVIQPPGTSRNFPDPRPASFDPIYALLVTHCSECHSSSAEFPQSPYFASSDPDEAYEAARTKINLDQPGLSRLVVRLSPEQHNCWFNTVNNLGCDGDAALMESAISTFAGLIPLDQVDDTFVISSALQLDDGIVASGGDRYEDNLIALWEFKEAPGTNIANDTSGVDPAIDLELLGDADFIGGWGVRINDGGSAQAFAGPSGKLYDTISLTGEYALEAWVAPANVTQDDAYIVTYSGSDNDRNFTMGQTLYNYDFMVRSSNTDANGMPALSTADADEDLQATLQHIVMNFDPVNGRSIYVNGVHTGDVDATVNQGGTIGSWANNFALILGNEASGNRQWTGTVRMVAIHNLTLTEAQIVQNFDVGVGLKYFLLFYLGDVLTNINEPYLMFEVSQFDGYSYLFNQPRFISLDPNENPAKVDMAGIRIGINGRLTEIGQAFAKIDTRPSGYVWNYTPDGHFLSDRGTIIALEKGSSQDEFFLRFDVLGTEQNVYIEPSVSQPAAPPDGTPVPDYGLRTFEEINASMAALTTVSPQYVNPTTQFKDIQFTYDRVKQQLPTAENLGGFLAAHQMAVAQLSIEYCNVLVNETGKRSTYWPGFDFSADVVTAFGTSASPNTVNRNLALDPLANRIALPDPDPTSLNEALLTGPSVVEMKGELNSLIDELMNCRFDPNDPLTPRGTQYCATDRTETIMKAVCATAVGNAAMLVQ